MTWITTKSPHENAHLKECMEKVMKFYPPEYAVPVAGLMGPEGQEPDSVLMSHSLLPDTLMHSFATFGTLISDTLPLSRKDHELIAATVSALNDCFY